MGEDGGVRVARRPGANPKGAAVEGISKYLRVRVATGVAALLSTAAVLMAISAPANAVCFLGFCPKDVSFEVVNDSRVPLFVEICPRGHSKQTGSDRPSAPSTQWG
jgi:hypothetical protein